MLKLEINAALATVFAATAFGLGLSAIIEQLMRPRPLFIRRKEAWAIHIGAWLSAHVVLTAALGRPWFSTAILSAFLLMLVLINNAKYKALREPFVFQDYDYFIDALRYPRLYIPFLGWWKFTGVSVGLLSAVSIGLWGEEPLILWLATDSQIYVMATLFCGGLFFLWAGSRKKIPVTFNPSEDVKRLGLLTSIWQYASEQKNLPSVASPFDFLPAKKISKESPHLVAVQSESFFDPRSIYQGVNKNILSEFDRLKKDGTAYGKLKVPAWGANTVRTEFSFLTGIKPEKIGVHQFNPFRTIANGWDVSSLATYLNSLGYHTICLHPYASSFYKRSIVYPLLDFDEFIDIDAFTGVEKFGPYIGDVPVANTLKKLFLNAKNPLFIFVITMENHGPLHLERVNPEEINELYDAAPPKGCEDLTIYLRHLGNADKMIGILRQFLEQCGRPASLCWFGDHVPIMPSVYKAFGVPSGNVEYVLWNSEPSMHSIEKDRAVADLSMEWLKINGLI